LQEGQSSKATLDEQRRGQVWNFFQSLVFLTARQIVAKNLVQKLLPHFFIRRDKRLLDGQLPKKIDQVAFCPLTEKQKVVYRNFLNTP
jgi:SNF2 family DNA or RNA helicase